MTEAIICLSLCLAVSVAANVVLAINVFVNKGNQTESERRAIK